MIKLDLLKINENFDEKELDEIEGSLNKCLQLIENSHKNKIEKIETFSNIVENELIEKIKNHNSVLNTLYENSCRNQIKVDEACLEFEEELNGNDITNKIKQIEESIEVNQEEIINEINSMDFKEICNIKFEQTEYNENAFHSIWKWFLDCLYNETEANYNWYDFKNKAFKKDNAEEFKRRLIILDTDSLENYETKEMLNITYIYENILKEKYLQIYSTLLPLFEIVNLLIKEYEYKKEIKKLNTQQTMLRNEIETDENLKEKLITESAIYNNEQEVFSEMVNIFSQIQNEFNEFNKVKI